MDASRSSRKFSHSHRELSFVFFFIKRVSHSHAKHTKSGATFPQRSAGAPMRGQRLALLPIRHSSSSKIASEIVSRSSVNFVKLSIVTAAV